jgi:hypothetical protein
MGRSQDLDAVTQAGEVCIGVGRVCFGDDVCDLAEASSLKPRVARAGVPPRRAEVTMADHGWRGVAGFLPALYWT